MNDNSRVLIVGNNSKNSINKYVWKEATCLDNVTYLSTIYRNVIFQLLFRLFFNNRIIRVFPILSKLKVFFKHSHLYNSMLNIPLVGFDLYIISPLILTLIDDSLLKKIKSNAGTKIIAVLIDSMSVRSVDENQSLMRNYNSSIIDRIYSFDTYDCKLHGFSYFEQIYTPIKIASVDIKYDIYFAGRDKGRFSLILDYLKVAKSYNASALIRMPELMPVKEALIKDVVGKNFKDEMLSYEETLVEMQECNCILEIIQENQTGISWRTVEALFYNKKLLTNNKDIVNNKFYNPLYIKVFQDIDDIDFNWVKEKITINYGYNNDYSPIKFIERVISEL